MSLVVWINGPFGVGKTTVTEQLVADCPNAIVFDPELVGEMLWKVLPADLLRADFQDIPLWRRMVRTTVSELIAEYRRPLIVPMTLVTPEYFEEIVGGLRRSGTVVAHFTLLAELDTVRTRLATRDDSEWALAQLPRCIPALQDEMFAEHVRTDDRDAEEIAKWILGRLPPDR